MSKRTEKAAEEKITALAEAPSPQEAHEQAKANFQAALEKTRAQTGEDPLKAVQRKDEPEPEKAEEAPPPKPKKTKPKAAEPDRYVALEKQVAALTKQLSEKEKPAKEEKKPDRMAEAAAFLKEKFGDDEGESLTHALKYVLEPLLAESQSTKEMLRTAMERSQKLYAKSARQSLGEKYERLKASDDAWEMVRSQGDALIQKDSERFATPEEAYAHVAQSLYGAPEEAEEVDEEDDDDSHAEEVEAAQVTSPTRTRTERKLTPEQRSKAVFMHLFEGKGDVPSAIKLRNQLSR